MWRMNKRLYGFIAALLSLSWVAFSHPAAAWVYDPANTKIAVIEIPAGSGNRYEIPYTRATVERGDVFGGQCNAVRQVGLDAIMTLDECLSNYAVINQLPPFQLNYIEPGNQFWVLNPAQVNPANNSVIANLIKSVQGSRAIIRVFGTTNLQPFMDAFGITELQGSVAQLREAVTNYVERFERIDQTLSDHGAELSTLKGRVGDLEAGNFVTVDDVGNLSITSASWWLKTEAGQIALVIVIVLALLALVALLLALYNGRSARKDHAAARTRSAETEEKVNETSGRVTDLETGHKNLRERLDRLEHRDVDGNFVTLGDVHQKAASAHGEIEKIRQELVTGLGAADEKADQAQASADKAVDYAEDALLLSSVAAGDSIQFVEPPPEGSEDATPTTWHLEGKFPSDTEFKNLEIRACWLTFKSETDPTQVREFRLYRTNGHIKVDGISGLTTEITPSKANVLRVFKRAFRDHRAVGADRPIRKKNAA